MKAFLNQVFVALGVIFFLLLLVLAYILVTDSYGVRTMVFGSDASTMSPNGNNGEEVATSGGGFALSEAQKQALINAGIDPSIVPSSISAAQESCFVGVFGEARVAEIRNGAVPNALEFVRAKSCI